MTETIVAAQRGNIQAYPAPVLIAKRVMLVLVVHVPFQVMEKLNAQRVSTQKIHWTRGKEVHHQFLAGLISSMLVPKNAVRVQLVNILTNQGLPNITIPRVSFLANFARVATTLVGRASLVQQIAKYVKQGATQ